MASPDGLTDLQLARTLGAAHPSWTLLLRQTAEAYAPMTCEWRFYPKPAIWSLRVRQRTRTLLYLLPRADAFDVVMVLGQRAVAAARATAFPAWVETALAEAPVYVEGTSVRFAVHQDAQVEVVGKLLALKMAPRPRIASE